MSKTKSNFALVVTDSMSIRDPINRQKCSKFQLTNRVERISRLFGYGFLAYSLFWQLRNIAMFNGYWQTEKKTLFYLYHLPRFGHVFLLGNHSTYEMSAFPPRWPFPMDSFSPSAMPNTFWFLHRPVVYNWFGVFMALLRFHPFAIACV